MIDRTFQSQPIVPDHDTVFLVEAYGERDTDYPMRVFLYDREDAYVVSPETATEVANALLAAVASLNPAKENS